MPGIDRRSERTVDFQELFSRDNERMDRGIRGNALEQHHALRCMLLADSVEWEKDFAGQEFRAMLGKKGTLTLDKSVKRINDLSSEERAPELRNPREFLRNVMFVHDLGKWKGERGEFDGANHEKRSADLVASRKRTLLQELHWQEESFDLFINLVRYHLSLGTIRLGGASLVFLSPLFRFLCSLSPKRRRLFLDYLILVTCCDAGASGDFAGNKFYLDDSRIRFYSHLSEELLTLAATLDRPSRADAHQVLLKNVSGLAQTADRIRSMVTGGNRLTVSRKVLETAVAGACSSGELDPSPFALTRFDHGAYVFEPLLAKLQEGRRAVSAYSLHRLLLLLGLLCEDIRSACIVRFRDSFSVKSGLGKKNQANFNELLEAVQGGDRRGIKEILARHNCKARPMESQTYSD